MRCGGSAHAGTRPAEESQDGEDDPRHVCRRKVLHRLPRDDRDDAGTRRRDGLDPRSPSFPRLDARDAQGQACVLSEADLALDLGSAPARGNRRPNEGADADGQPGARGRADPARRRTRAGRSDRTRHRGARVDGPPDLAARDEGVAEGRPGAEGSQLGAVDWASSVPRLQQSDRAVQLARVVGFRGRRPGRHGLPHHGHAVLGTRAHVTHFGGSQTRRRFRDRRPELVDGYVPVSDQRARRAGEVRVVRWRQGEGGRLSAHSAGRIVEGRLPDARPRVPPLRPAARGREGSDVFWPHAAGLGLQARDAHERFHGAAEDAAPRSR